MRLAVCLTLIMQMLLRGVAVPHSHGPDGLGEPAGHDSRPHVHVFPAFVCPGHHHESSVAQHQHQHEADEPQHADPADHHLGATREPCPEHPTPQHDETAIYVGDGPASHVVKRVQLPAAAEIPLWSLPPAVSDVASGCDREAPSEADRWRPPTAGTFHLRPHQLQV